MAEAPKAAPALKYTEAETRCQIIHPRYLSGYFQEDGSFLIVDGAEPHFVQAAPDFPAIVVLPAGHKLDRGYKVLAEGQKAEAVKAKKHYPDVASGLAPSVTKVPNAADAAKKQGKRPSEESPI